MDKYKGRYKSIMMKVELKDELDSIMFDMNKKMSYSEIIYELIKNYKNERKENEVVKAS